MILITGSTGHLGANLVRRVIKDGLPVRLFLRRDSSNAAVDGLEAEHAYGDLRDLASVRAAVQGCDRIYHCAAMLSTTAGREREIYDCNVIGTQNVLRAARECKVARVVVTGSLSAVGNPEGRASDETMPFYPFEKHLPY